MPSAATSMVLCPDGSRKTRQERLNNLPDIPKDDRGAEVAAALAFTSLVGFCFVTNVLGMEEITPFTNGLLTVAIALGVIDNFYGIIKGAVSLAAKDKIDVNLPEQQDLPLGLGSGSITGTVLRGLTRLSNVDTERECECEAAAFFAAYALGLPCFAFRPNALEVCTSRHRHMRRAQVVCKREREKLSLLVDILYSLLSNIAVSHRHLFRRLQYWWENP